MQRLRPFQITNSFCLEELTYLISSGISSCSLDLPNYLGQVAALVSSHMNGLITFDRTIEQKTEKKQCL